MGGQYGCGRVHESSNDNVPAGGGYRFALSVLASLFFMWGFLSVLDDILVPHLKAVFDLNYTQSLLIQCTWFITYFAMSLPSARLLERIGYKKSLVTGLVTMATGCLLLLPAAEIAAYPFFLFALFVIASGITLLQVAANPYVAVIGPADSAPARLNLVQALNTAGDTVAPLFGTWLILDRSKSGTSVAGAVLSHADRLADARSVELPYVGIAVVLLLLAVVIAKLKLPEVGVATARATGDARKKLSLWKHRNLVFGVPAIFIYLIAEIGVASLFINFVKSPDIGNMTAADAGHYLTLLWGGMMVGRFIGSGVMQFVAAEKLLAFNAICAFALLLVVVFGTAMSPCGRSSWSGCFIRSCFPPSSPWGSKAWGPSRKRARGS